MSKPKTKNAGSLGEAHRKYIRKALRKARDPEQIRLRKKSKRIEDYRERQSWYFSRFKNHLCAACRTVFKKRGTSKEICPSCGKEMVFIGIFERVPRKNSSNKKWEVFFKRNHINV